MKKTQVIFNLKQANVLFRSGLCPLGCDTHRVTKKVFFTFEVTDKFLNIINKKNPTTKIGI